MQDIQCETLRFPSADGRHTVNGLLYTAKGRSVRAVVQLSHGMCEYVARYGEMAAFLAQNGYAFAGNDHLGHGETATPDEYGFFAEHGGREAVLEDLHNMNRQLHARFPKVPVILLGHSMGSFFARWYAERYGDTIDGLMLSGTGGPNAANTLGWLLAGAIRAVRGPRYVSTLMIKLNFGNYCAHIDTPSSPNAWLSRDEAAVNAYDTDPKCGFPFTAGSYQEMLWVLRHVSKRRWAQAIRKDLPILLYAGAEDPVGNYGEGVRAVWAMLGDAGVSDLTCQIWEGGRHEMHNETNRAEVLQYLLGWLELHWPHVPGTDGENK